MGGNASRAERRPSSGTPSTCCSGWLSFKRPGKAVDASHRAAAASTASALHHAGSSSGRTDEGRAILRAILGIERRCLGQAPAAEQEADAEAEEDLQVECMLDEEDKRYFLCSSLSSPIVIAYFWLRFPDVRLEDLRLALVNCQERQQRDSDSEYQELRSAQKGDPTFCEDVSYVLRVPWPFSDREILQRRWQLPLGGKGEGVAIVMRSFEDEALCPRRQDRVRAVLQKGAYMLRPFGAPRGTEALRGPAATGVPPLSTELPEACWQAEDAPGLELVVCQQLDLGGLCPAWAQRFVTRFAIQTAVEWSRKIRDHCITMRRRRAGHHVPEDSGTPGPRRENSTLSRGSSKPRSWSGNEVLQAILAIERCCCCSEDGLEQGFGSLNGAKTPNWIKEDGAESSVGKNLSEASNLMVECLLDEPTAKYCLCGSLDSPVVIGYIRVLLADVYPGDVWRALVATEERLLRDPASEYKVLRKAADGDDTCQEDISFVWRAPWPFWDRDVLQRRWTFPLHEGEGLAIVMRSIEDDFLLPLREDRVRAFVHKCGYLLRPLERSRKEQLAKGDPAWNGGAGLELTVCQQVDLGGLCPDWAQEVLTRWAVNRGLSWAEELREHCLNQHRRRAESAGEPSPRPPA